MSTFFSGGQYGNGGYNSGIPTQGQFNYQPFMMPIQDSLSMSGSMSGGSAQGGNHGNDPLSQYFGGRASSGLDSFNGSGDLGLGSHGGGSGHGGDSSSSSSSHAALPDTTLLARFQGLSKKLDTMVKPEADGLIDANDLEVALKDKSEKFTKEDKQVIQGMMDNTSGMRGKLDHLDGSDDGLLKIDSINKMVVNPDAKQQTPENEMSNTEACNVMGDYIKSAIHLSKAGRRADKYVDKHGSLLAPLHRGAWTTDREKLQKMSEDEKVPEKVRTAAKKMLENKQLLDTIDTAKNGDNPDGKYSLHDFKAAAKMSGIDTIGQSATEPSGLQADHSAGSTPSLLPPFGGILPPPAATPTEQETEKAEEKPAETDSHGGEASGESAEASGGGH